MWDGKYTELDQSECFASRVRRIVRSMRQNIIGIPLSPSPFPWIYILQSHKRQKRDSGVVGELSTQRNNKLLSRGLWAVACSSIQWVRIECSSSKKTRKGTRAILCFPRFPAGAAWYAGHLVFPAAFASDVVCPTASLARSTFST